MKHLNHRFQNCKPFRNRLNRYREIANVISGLAAENVGVDVPVKFGGPRSNGFLDIRGADFVSNKRTIERTNIKWPIPIARNASPKKRRLVLIKCRSYMSRVLWHHWQNQSNVLSVVRTETQTNDGNGWTRSPPLGGERQNATPLCSKTLPIFFTREIWKCLWHCITLNARLHYS